MKIILYCYSIGIISSRKIAKLSKYHMVVKALAEDTEPHYTTISNFVSGMGGEIEKVFSEVLLVLFIPILKYKENLSQKMREKIDTPK